MHLVPHSLWQKQPVGQRAFVHAHDARSSAVVFLSPQHKRSSEPRTLLAGVVGPGGLRDGGMLCGKIDLKPCERVLTEVSLSTLGYL